jgi:hypothetical protein
MIVATIGPESGPVWLFGNRTWNQSSTDASFHAFVVDSFSVKLAFVDDLFFKETTFDRNKAK